MIDIKSIYPIYKLSNSVFQIGNINYDQILLNDIISLLDLGNKFVPNYFQHNSQFVQFLLRNIDLNKIDFNKNMMLKMFSKYKNKNTNNNRNLINSSNIDDHYFNDILSFMKSKKRLNTDELFINKEIQEFRLNIHKRLLKMYKKIDIKPNINLSQLKTIIQFQTKKPFKIIDCDKNIGLALISNELYDKSVNEYLDKDTTTYQKIDFNPLSSISTEINNSLENLLKNGHISAKVFSLIKIREIDCKLGSFRLFAKLHKENFSWRPIINCRNHPTSKISKMMDLILKPIVMKTESSIKYLQNLIQKCQKLKFDKKLYLY